MTSHHDLETTATHPGTAASPRRPEPVSHRRNFLASALATLIGGVLALFPVAVGVIPFLDPLRPGKRGLPNRAGSSLDAEGYVRLGTLDALPDDGTPQLVKVIADHVDAWTYFPSQPIGAVYLRKTAEGSGDDPPSVTAFNVTCPHAGCAVDFRHEKRGYYCPCHNSTFSVDGQRSPDSPSPRDLDRLDVQVRDGEVWVKYQDYRTGTAERIPVA